jgi:hypothetical protein
MGSLTAGDALAAAGIDIAAVRRELPAVEPFAVSIRPASPLFQRFWARSIVAVAMPWGVYVRPVVFDRIRTGAEPSRDGPLVVHELTHIEQFRRLGPLRHIAQYVGDYLGGRRRGRGHWEAYRNVRLEVEAREVAARFSPGQVPR